MIDTFSPYQVVLNVRTLMVYHTVSGLLPLLGVGQKGGIEGGGDSAKLLGYVTVSALYRHVYNVHACVIKPGFSFL